jgi:hypothetical protein
MKKKLLFLLFYSIFIRGDVEAQQVIIKIDTLFRKFDSIPVFVEIISKKKIWLPIKTSPTQNIFSFSIIKYDIELDTNCLYLTRKPFSLRNYVPTLGYAKKVNRKQYSLAIWDERIQPSKSYRIRFTLCYNNFNKGIKNMISKWYYFRTI